MKAFKIEIGDEVVMINPLHIVYAKVVDNKLVVRLTDGSSFEKIYENHEEAKKMIGSHWGTTIHVADALSSVSLDK